MEMLSSNATVLSVSSGGLNMAMKKLHSTKRRRVKRYVTLKSFGGVFLTTILLTPKGNLPRGRKYDLRWWSVVK